MIPERIDYTYLRERFLCNFTDIFKDVNRVILETCIEDVYTNYAGVATIWQHLEPRLYVEKTKLCYAYLVAWYITDTYPDFVVGVQTMGGLPIKEKRIGDVYIKYDTSFGINYYHNDILSELRTNTFGLKAYYMIRKSGKLNTFVKVG